MRLHLWLLRVGRDERRAQGNGFRVSVVPSYDPRQGTHQPETTSYMLFLENLQSSAVRNARSRLSLVSLEPIRLKVPFDHVLLC